MENSLAKSDSSHGLPANALKLIAAAAMLIDHIAWCFVAKYSVLGQIMHIIGRLTAPIMCFFIAEGFYYTKNVKKYLLRLGIFAVISWFPYVFMDKGTFPVYFYGGRLYLNPNQSVIYTFFLGLLTLVIIHSEKLKIPIKILLTAGIVFLSFFGDWPIFAIVWIVIFNAFRGNFRKQAAFFSASSVIILILFYGIIQQAMLVDYLFQFGVLLALVPLYFYNGKRSKDGKNRQLGKWFFYVFYPLHMLVLGILRNII